MSSFAAFFKSMFTEWASGMTGGMSVPLTIMAFYVEGRTQKTFWGGLAVLAFGYAAFRVFDREHERAIEAEAKLDDQKPKLSLRIDGALWDYDAETDLTHIWLSVTIGNGGGPSVVKDWAATYRNGDTVISMSMPLLGNYGERISAGKHYLEMTNADLLQARTAETVIDRRSQRRGKIRVDVVGNRTTELGESKASINLSCADFEGFPASDSFSPSDPCGSVAIYPHENVKQYTEPRIMFL